MLTVSCQSKDIIFRAILVPVPFFILLVLASSCLPSVSSFSPTSSFRPSATFQMSSQPPQLHHSIQPTEECDEPPPENSYYWCPIQQIYIGGVPEENGLVAVDEMIRNNQGSLRIFGYGSLCWNPGAVESALGQARQRRSGRAKNYRRCWAQKSTDHRGTTAFPGIVCTLLTTQEFRQFRPLTNTNNNNNNDPDVNNNDNNEDTTTTIITTEGVIYTVPPQLVQECLSDLDFREKGGYARDIIEVVEDETGETVQCLLYRGTPDNPAFWSRALKDLPYAAAVMSAAIGPSGKNDEYLHKLDVFLEQTGDINASEKCDDTFALARMVERYHKTDYRFFFFVGCGSNQYNQLLLKSDDNVAGLVNDEDAHVLTESVVAITGNGGPDDPVVELVAGSGHSGVLTASGRLFLFGWNANSQLGTCKVQKDESGLSVVSELQGLSVEKVVLGFSHSLVVEKTSSRLYAFGDNSRGQVTGEAGGDVTTPATPSFLENDKIVSVAAGLYHTAVVTDTGDLVVYGCNRYGQSLSSGVPVVQRWRPSDGASLQKVACGRFHTVVLDSVGRVWTFGDNRFGQLGRSSYGKKFDASPCLIALPSGYVFVDVACGWSHNLGMAKKADGEAVVFGWGRNDKGQLGTTGSCIEPTRIPLKFEPLKFVCGSESTVFVDDKDCLWCSGWNEHGNLASGNAKDRFDVTRASGAPIVTTPGYHGTKLRVAVGGAHLLAGMVVSKN